MEEKEDKFVFVDKRGQNQEKPEEKVPEDIPTEEEKLSKEELKVINLSRGFISFLSQVAWWNLGLVPHPQSGKVQKDLLEAKLAIDTASAIFEILQNNLPDEEKKQFRTILSDLKLNYVNISSRSEQ